MGKVTNRLALLSLAIWWGVPVLLTMGVPGYAVASILIAVLLALYISIQSHPASVALWLPLMALSALATGAFLYGVAAVAMLLTSGSPAGPWVGGLFLVYGGPALFGMGLIFTPVFVLLLRVRPSTTTPFILACSVINTCLLCIVVFQVLNYHRGEAYKLSKPKLVRVTHFPPVSPEEKKTVQWLDQINEAGADVQYQQPIDFYGMAVDQDGKPLSGVQIRYAASPSNLPATAEEPILTGPDGRFQILGLHGVELGVMASREGYWKTNSSQAMDPFWFLDYRSPQFYVPDPENPAVFTFQKVLPSEPLYEWHDMLPVEANGARTYIDPVTGRASESSRPGVPWVTVSSGSPSDQSDFVVTIGVSEPGGVFKLEPGLESLAPESGYQPTFQSPSLPLFSTFDLPVYFKTPDGKFGVLTIDGFLSKGFGPRITYTVRFNPSGSRVLIQHPLTQINPEAAMRHPNGKAISPSFLGFWGSQVSQNGQGIWLRDDGTGYHGMYTDSTVPMQPFFWIQGAPDTVQLVYFGWKGVSSETVVTCKFDAASQSLVTDSMYTSANRPPFPEVYKRRAP